MSKSTGFLIVASLHLWHLKQERKCYAYPFGSPFDLIITTPQLHESP